MPTIEWIAVDTLKPNARNARTHSRRQIRQIADSIAAFGFLVPILIDEGRVVIAGHGRYAAAKLLGLKQVPAIEVRDLSEAKRRALSLADNKIAENAGWDRELLSAELPELADLLVVEGLDISITGFPHNADVAFCGRGLQPRDLRFDFFQNTAHNFVAVAVSATGSVIF